MPSLNTVLQQFRARKAELLRMLEVPQVPLHNNGAESDIREYVHPSQNQWGALALNPDDEPEIPWWV